MFQKIVEIILVQNLSLILLLLWSRDMNLTAKKGIKSQRNYLVACAMLLTNPLLTSVMCSVSGGTKLVLTMYVCIHTCMSISICQELPNVHIIIKEVDQTNFVYMNSPTIFSLSIQSAGISLWTIMMNFLPIYHIQWFREITGASFPWFHEIARVFSGFMKSQSEL